MEDKKRPLDDPGAGSSPEPHKLPKLDTLSESGPLTQLDVVYFKKEAIWRQMKFYKLQAADLAAQVAKYDRRFQTFVAAHLLLESWYRQVLVACGRDAPALLDLAAASEDAESVLAERRRILADLLKPLASDSSDAMLDVVTLAAEKEAAILLRQELQTQLDALREKLLAMQREKHRGELATLQRIVDSSRVKTETPEIPDGTAPQQQESVQSEAASSADKDALEKLTVEHAEIKAAYSALELQLAHASEKLAHAEKRSSDLELRLASLSVEDLARSERYMALVTQNKSLSENLAQTTRLKNELVQTLRELEKEDGNLAASINKDLEEENTRLKESLSKSENDLVRIRTARDELLAKLSILKLEIENKKTNEEVNKMNLVLSRRLEELEKARLQQRSVEDDPNLDKLEKTELIKRLQILATEVKEIEQAFQDTRAVTLEKLKETIDHESMLKKATIEKNKADQKYFASMRLKDSLVAENKILKTQTAKSQELVGKLNEMEKTYLAKIDLLTKTVNDFRVIKEGSIHENVKLQETLKQITKSREMVGKELATLKNDLNDANKENSDLAAELKAKRISESKLEAKLKATETLLLKYKLNNTSSILQEDEKQLEALRSITKCSVCSKNWKNTVITACGHVFCDACVQDRLNARLRRCPTCNRGFASNDLLSIHL